MAATQNTVVGTIALDDESKAAMNRLSDVVGRFMQPDMKAQDAPPKVPQIIEWEPRTRPPRVIAQCPACGVHVDSIAETFEIVLPDDGSDMPTRIFGRLRHDHEDGSVTTWPYIADEPKPDIVVDIDVEVPDALVDEPDVEEGQQRDRDEPFEFTPEADGSLPLRSAVFQALGAASVCWEDMSGTGVFQSERATEIGEALMVEIAKGGGWKPEDESLRQMTSAWLAVAEHPVMKAEMGGDGIYLTRVMRRLDQAGEDAARVRYFEPRDRMMRSAIARAHDRLTGVGVPDEYSRNAAARAVLEEVIERAVGTMPMSDVEVGGQWMTQQQFDAASAADRTEAERLRGVIRKARSRLNVTLDAISAALDAVDKKVGE